MKTMVKAYREYAAALFSLAREHDAEAEYRNALHALREMMDENPEYIAFLSSPCIPRKERVKALEEALASSCPEQVLTFLQLLTEHGLARDFSAAVSEYDRLYNAANSIVCAEIASAVELTPAEKDAVRQKLEAMSGCSVQLRFIREEALLGGMAIRIGDWVLDGSLKGRLCRMKGAMLA